jgi:predicted PurR-regulated permease PerM
MAQSTPQPTSPRRAQDREDGRIGRAALRIALIVLVVAVATYVVWRLSNVVLLAFVAIILASALAAPISVLEHRGVPRILALLAVYAAVIGIIVGALLLIVPPLAAQLTELAQRLPAFGQELWGVIEPWFVAAGVPTDPDEIFDLVIGQLGNMTGVIDQLTGIPMIIASGVFGLATVAFMSALIILEQDRGRRWLLRFVAPAQRDEVRAVGRKSVERLGAYVRGQLFVMAVVGTAVTIGLTLLGVPFALPLGVLAFLFEIVPIVGPIIAGIPIVIIAFLESPVQGVIALIGFAVIQQLESYVLIPLVQGRVIEISPLVALLAILAGGTLGGILGALLAIPAVAVATVIVEDVILPWRERQYGRSGPVTRTPATGEAPP